MKVSDDSPYGVYASEDPARRVIVNRSLVDDDSVVVFSGEGPGCRIPARDLRDALLKAFPLEDEKSEPAQEETPFDPDLAIEEARTYAKNEANAAYGRAFAEFITSVFPA